MKCNICPNQVQDLIYLSQLDRSITSLCELYPQKTEIFFCQNCGHLQKTPIQDIESYYDKTYQILIDTEEEDQLYEVIEGRNIFRIDRQVEVVLNKIEIPQDARILDYGCAKSSTLKKLTQIRSDIIPHLFDVSEMYVPFWKSFVPQQNWSIYTVKPEWNESFDLVTSFFALEHIAEPLKTIATIERLIKPGGIFYCIVPNTYTNIADFVVIDHVNHFSETSLKFLLQTVGFESIDIDTDIHRGAFVIVAKKSTNVSRDVDEIIVDKTAVENLQEQTAIISHYWQEIANKVRDFESKQDENHQIAIYGSGFYGTFIATCLHDLERVNCFVDRSPYRQGKYLLDKPIIAPKELSNEIETDLCWS